MRGSLSEFSSGDILQLYQISGRTGVLRVVQHDREHRIYIDRGRISGAGATDWDLVDEIRRIEWLPASIDPQLDVMKQDGSFVGLSLVARAVLGDDAWEHFVELQLERLVYPMLTWEDGEFFADVDLVPRVAPLRFNQSPQQLVLAAARWEEEGKVAERAGYTPDSCWVRRTDGMPDDPDCEIAVYLPFLSTPRRLHDLCADTGRSLLVTVDALRKLERLECVTRAGAG